MDVDESVSERGEGGIFQNAHEAGEDDDVRAGDKEVIVDGLLGCSRGAQGVRATIDDGRGKMMLCGKKEEAGVGFVGEGQGDLSVERAGVNGVKERGEVRACAGAEYSDAERGAGHFVAVGVCRRLRVAVVLRPGTSERIRIAVPAASSAAFSPGSSVSGV